MYKHRMIVILAVKWSSLLYFCQKKQPKKERKKPFFFKLNNQTIPGKLEIPEINDTWKSLSML